METVVCHDCRFNNKRFPCLGRDGKRDYDKLAEAYIGREMNIHKDSSGSEWARECVRALEAVDPGATLYFILIALDRLGRANAANLSSLAAGPLEAILDGFGEAVIGPVETIAKKSPKFRLLLSSVWGASRIAPAVWKRVQKAVENGPLLDQDHRTPGFGSGTAPVSEEEFWQLIETSCLADLGGREPAAALTGAVPG
ncbi:MAG TPA: hypothetical protein VKT73_06785 [Xanthobacteraceae bacterium]|nr:hypothetical protein [Xanthobacteraceae bacterium]